MTEKTAEQYESSIRLAADSTGQLRKTDVFRVVEDADDRGFLEEFAAWLSAVRCPPGSRGRNRDLRQRNLIPSGEPLTGAP